MARDTNTDTDTGDYRSRGKDTLGVPEDSRPRMRGWRMTDSGRLRVALRLIVITDPALAAPRPVEWVVEEALEAGARAIQLREKGASAREFLARGRALRELTRAHDALLFVNDRFDLALAVEADGVHLGPHDLPVEVVRKVAPEGFLIGHSTDRVEVAREAVEAGADYIGCGTVLPTPTKKDAGDAIGIDGLERVAREVTVPVVGIGGITPLVARDIAERSGAAGVAVIGAVMAAPDPGAVVRALLAPFQNRP